MIDILINFVIFMGFVIGFTYAVFTLFVIPFLGTYFLIKYINNKYPNRKII